VRVFLELFSGVGHLAGSMARQGGAVLRWDITMGPMYDVLDLNNQKLIRGWVMAGLVWAVHLGTPCTTFSVARRPAVRSMIFPMGLPGLSEIDAGKVSVGNDLLRFSIGLLKICRRMGAPCTLENPASSLLFKTPSFIEVAALSGFSSAQCDYCMFGTPWKKPTRVIGFGIHVDRLSAYQCRGAGRGICCRTLRPHLRLSGTSEGKNKTLIAQPYPRLFCTTLARCFIDSIAERMALILTTRLRA
jgi:hypothetical protein